MGGVKIRCNLSPARKFSRSAPSTEAVREEPPAPPDTETYRLLSLVGSAVKNLSHNPYLRPPCFLLTSSKNSMGVSTLGHMQYVHVAETLFP